jgi:2'-5' RNA ligase
MQTLTGLFREDGYPNLDAVFREGVERRRKRHGVCHGTGCTFWAGHPGLCGSAPTGPVEGADSGGGDDGGGMSSTAARKPYTEDVSDDGPVTLHYHRRVDAPAPNMGSRFGQDIEPNGQYFSQGKLGGDHLDNPIFEHGQKSFQRPLRIHLDDWKSQLSQRYQGQTGKGLSQAIRNDGYDAILTHDEYGPSESVDLSNFRPKKAAEEHIGEDKYEKEPDDFHDQLWDRWHPKLQPTVHRHLALDLPKGHPAHDTKLPMADRAHAVLEAATSGDGYRPGKMGVNWTDDPTYDHLSSGNGRVSPGQTRVTIHAQTPPRHHIEDDDYTLEQRGVRDWDTDPEREVPLKRNAPMNVTGVSWHSGDGPQRHTFEQPISKKAQYEQEHSWLPTGRYWGPNSGHNDQRLFEGEHLRPEIRKDILKRVGDFFDGHGYKNWPHWTKVYFAGSEAAQWEPFNGDFDILIGINWPHFRKDNRGYAKKNDLQVTTEMTDGLWKSTNVDDYYFTLDSGKKVGPFDRTFFVNPIAWDISKLHPYAAYDVSEDEWAVSPLKVPKDWSAEKLPEGYWVYAESLVATIKAIGTLPAEERHRMARNLWEELHTHRSDAFADGGHGLFDLSNVVEKYLDQHPDKPWDQLRDWKNTSPVGPEPWVPTTAARRQTLTTIFQEAAVRTEVRDPGSATGADYEGIMIALVPPKKVCKDLALDGGEPVESMHVTLAYLGSRGEHSKNHIKALPNLVKSWASTRTPLTATVGGVGTFVNPTQHVLWAAVDIPDGTTFRDDLVRYLEGHGYEIRNDHGWTPHVTLQYSKSRIRFLPKVDPMEWPVSEVWVCIGKHWASFPLGG